MSETVALTSSSVDFSTGLPAESANPFWCRLCRYMLSLFCSLPVAYAINSLHTLKFQNQDTVDILVRTCIKWGAGRFFRRLLVAWCRVGKNRTEPNGWNTDVLLPCYTLQLLYSHYLIFTPSATTYLCVLSFPLFADKWFLNELHCSNETLLSQCTWVC